MSRGSRWVIVAFLLLFSWMVLAGWESDTPRQRVWEVGIAAFMLVLALGLIAPGRAHWAIRFVAGLVGVGYLIYFADEVIRLLRGERQPLTLSQPSATTAGLGFLFYGIPGLIYALGLERVGVARLFRSRSRDDSGDVDAGEAEPSDVDQNPDDR